MSYLCFEVSTREEVRSVIDYGTAAHHEVAQEAWCPCLCSEPPIALRSNTSALVCLSASVGSTARPSTMASVGSFTPKNVKLVAAGAKNTKDF